MASELTREQVLQIILNMCGPQMTGKDILALRDHDAAQRAQREQDRKRIKQLVSQVEQLETINGFTRGTFAELYALREQVQQLSILTQALAQARGALEKLADKYDGLIEGCDGNEFRIYNWVAADLDKLITALRKVQEGIPLCDAQNADEKCRKVRPTPRDQSINTSAFPAESTFRSIANDAALAVPAAGGGELEAALADAAQLRDCSEVIRDQLNELTTFIGLKRDEQTGTWVSGKPPYLSAGNDPIEACKAAVDALRLANNFMAERLSALAAAPAPTPSIPVADLQALAPLGPTYFKQAVMERVEEKENKNGK